MREIWIRTFIALSVSLSGYALAANYSDPIDGTFKGTYGDTISIEVPSLVSKSPVANQDENGDLTFQLRANTGYKNFNQLTDLKYGDAVRVQYSEDPTGKTKQMVADTITKIEPEVVANPVAVVNTDTTTVPEPTVTQTVVTTTTKVQ